MKRIARCMIAAGMLLATANAAAQDFGKQRTLAVSAERLFGFSWDSATTTTNGVDATSKVTSISLLSAPLVASGNTGVWAGYGSPRIAADYFIIDHLSLGVALGYSHVSVTNQGFGNTETTSSGDSFTFAPRVGYFLSFSDLVGFWPRAGFTYRTFDAEPLGSHDLALTLEAPFTFNVFPHVVIWGGPTLDLGLSGSQNFKQGNGTTLSRDFNATEIGIQTALLIYFGV